MPFYLLLFVLLSPGLLYAQDVTYNFTITWTDNSNDEVGFNIYRDGKVIGQVGKDVTTYKEAVTGPAKQQYCWEVDAYNTKGKSAKAPKACMALPDAPPTAKPNAPSGMTVTQETATAIRMSWALNSTNESSVEVRRDTATPPAAITDFKLPAGTTIFTDEKLPPLTTYCYQSRAVNSLGASAYSGKSCGTTLAK